MAARCGLLQTALDRLAGAERPEWVDLSPLRRAAFGRYQTSASVGLSLIDMSRAIPNGVSVCKNAP